MRHLAQFAVCEGEYLVDRARIPGTHGLRKLGDARHRGASNRGRLTSNEYALFAQTGTFSKGNISLDQQLASAIEGSFGHLHDICRQRGNCRTGRGPAVRSPRRVRIGILRNIAAAP
jgi:hypothetical protein